MPNRHMFVPHKKDQTFNHVRLCQRRPGARTTGQGASKARLWIALGGWLLAWTLNSCATGRTEFTVVKVTPVPTVLETPQATPTVEPTGNSLSSQVGEKSSGPEVREYTVQPGDSLWRISRRWLGDARWYLKLAQANAVANPDLIQPGLRLRWESGLPPAGVAGATPARVAETREPAVAVESRTKSEAPKSTPVPTPVFPVRTNQAFKPGEHLLFAVQYFNIAAGFATLDVENGPVKNNRSTYRIVAGARTHPAFEWMFKVRDRIESYMDQQGLFSWQYEKHLREGGYSNDSVIVYDQLNRRVIKDEGRTVVPAPPWVQDVLSEFYFFRTLKFDIGDVVTVPVVADDGKSYELLVTIVRRERMTVPAGTFDCIVVEPALKFEGLFQQKGKITMWLTDDAHKVPVLIKTQIVIGTIDIVLREAKIIE